MPKGKPYLNHSESPAAIAERKPFRNSTRNLRGEPRMGGKSLPSGWLNKAERNLLDRDRGTITYVVFSFDTPIAWFSNESGWHIVNQGFSVVTSTKHQSRLYLIPTWDDESIAYSLSDCKHWDKPGAECGGPRVGKVVRDGVILCEYHYNQS